MNNARNRKEKIEKDDLILDSNTCSLKSHMTMIKMRDENIENRFPQCYVGSN